MRKEDITNPLLHKILRLAPLDCAEKIELLSLQVCQATTLQAMMSLAPSMPHCATCTCCQQQDAQAPSKPIPGFLADFLNDPRTVNLRQIHRTSVHVAFLVRRGKVLAQATNRIGSRSRGAGFSDLTIHAERNVVKQLGDNSQLRGADMYIMRMSKSAMDLPPVFQSSKPCHDCELFLTKCMREYGLKNVYYTS